MFEAQVEPGHDGMVVVRVAGEIDIAVAALLGHVLCRAAHGHGARHVVVDLAGVEFLDSSGIHALARGYHAATGVGATFMIRNAVSIVLRVLRVAGVAEIFGLDGAGRIDRDDIGRDDIGQDDIGRDDKVPEARGKRDG